MNTEATNINELKKRRDRKAIAMEKIKQSIEYAPQPYLLLLKWSERVAAAYEAVVDEYATNNRD